MTNQPTRAERIEAAAKQAQISLEKFLYDEPSPLYRRLADDIGIALALPPDPQPQPGDAGLRITGLPAGTLEWDHSAPGVLALVFTPDPQPQPGDAGLLRELRDELVEWDRAVTELLETCGYIETEVRISVRKRVIENVIGRIDKLLAAAPADEPEPATTSVETDSHLLRFADQDPDHLLSFDNLKVDGVPVADHVADAGKKVCAAVIGYVNATAVTCHKPVGHEGNCAVKYRFERVDDRDAEVARLRAEIDLAQGEAEDALGGPHVSLLDAVCKVVRRMKGAEAEEERLRASPLSVLGGESPAAVLRERSEALCEVERLTKERDEARGIIDDVESESGYCQPLEDEATQERPPLSEWVRDIVRELDRARGGWAALERLREWIGEQLESLSPLNDDEYNRGVRRTAQAVIVEIDNAARPAQGKEATDG